MRILNTFLVFSFLLCQLSWAEENSVLEQVAAKVADQGGVVIFDLDDTLFDTAGRHKAILAELKRDPELSARFPEQTQKIFKHYIPNNQYRYHFEDNLKLFDITDPEFVSLAKQFWSQRFFQNDYLLRDSLVRGAVDYVNRLKDLGAKVIYLTGRDESLRVGTLRMFLNLGLPLRLHIDKLLMKPQLDQSDENFKENVIAQIKNEQQKVIATFENEPVNANLFQSEFPEATNVLLNTRHSGQNISPSSDLITLKDFLYVRGIGYASPLESPEFRTLVAQYELYVEASGYFKYEETKQALDLTSTSKTKKMMTGEAVFRLIKEQILGHYAEQSNLGRKAMQDLKRSLKGKQFAVSIQDTHVPYYQGRDYVFESEDLKMSFITAWED